LLAFPAAGQTSTRACSPRDIDIATAQAPKPIAEIAEEIGLAPEEYDLHGTTKAKVRRTHAAPGTPSPPSAADGIRHWRPALGAPHS